MNKSALTSLTIILALNAVDSCGQKFTFTHCGRGHECRGSFEL